MGERGTALTEVACIFLLIAIAALASITVLGNKLTNNFDQTAHNINNGPNGVRADYNGGGGISRGRPRR